MFANFPNSFPFHENVNSILTISCFRFKILEVEGLYSCIKNIFGEGHVHLLPNMSLRVN